MYIDIDIEIDIFICKHSDINYIKKKNESTVLSVKVTTYINNVRS